MTDETITQHCECGSETYHIKTTIDRAEAWAECTECGRPTAVFADGPDRQQHWYAEQ
jgi:hypothetical protein